MRVISITLLLSCALCTLIGAGNGSKILGIFPFPARSHYLLGEILLRGLVERGHEVTMISPFKLSEPIKNYQEVIIPDSAAFMEGQMQKFTFYNDSMWQKVSNALDFLSTSLHMMHNHTNIKNFLARGEKYDACIVSIALAESMFAVCREVHATPIAFTNVGINPVLAYHTNNPAPYSYVPNAFSAFTDKMNFLERVQNTVMWMFFDALYNFVTLPYITRITKIYYPNAPALDVILEDVDLHLMNSHISTDTPKPILPNIIPIGGFHLQVIESIPQDIAAFLAKSKNGVIYFNLGSNIKSSELDSQLLDNIFNAFAEIDFDVLWKFEKELPNKPENVFIAKWLPQRSILMHPKVKVFITHGGLGGTVEAIYGGVPMICMPLFGDQGKNCAESETNGYAITLDLKSLTKETLVDVIKKITGNSSYQEMIDLKSDLYKNQEINPMDKAVFWIEHAIRHKGAKHLKSQAAFIPWHQYYLLDVMAFLAAIIFVALVASYFVIRINFRVLKYIFCKITGRTCSKNTKLKTN